MSVWASWDYMWDTLIMFILTLAIAGLVSVVRPHCCVICLAGLFWVECGDVWGGLVV